ncbi:MAG: hypothetical protein ACI4NV_02560 [Thermoguttaceae bacterium]
MFAISVLSYMIVTSNMAETAQNAQKLDAALSVPPQDDVNVALRSLLIGSNNQANPIGPFSILENMYGDWRVYDSYTDSEDRSTTFDAKVAIFPYEGCAVVVPLTDYSGHPASSDDYQYRQMLSKFFEESGNVLTFMGLSNNGNLDSDTIDLWNSEVENTSAYVIEKVVTNPSASTYKTNSGEYWAEHYSKPYDSSDPSYIADNQWKYADLDQWHFKVELTDSLKNFTSRLSDFEKFNTDSALVTVRLNRPAYSGTGAGGFSPGDVHDSVFDPNSTPDLLGMRMTYSFWMNPSAPDLWPFYMNSVSPLNFRSYWAHLTDVNYDPTLYSSDGLLYGDWNGAIFNRRNTVLQGVYGDNYCDYVRMNPSYTAPDSRSPFLAFLEALNQDNGADSEEYPYSSITPSFHRPGSFEMLAGGALWHYAGKYSTGMTARLTALMRKLTPRPLPLDHWRFTGGNPDLENFKPSDSSSSDLANEATRDFVNNATSLAEALSGVRNYYDGDGNLTSTETLQYDVDNDNDGVREGVWIPSGLPIRYDKNGTPYATMFSYTVVDLDGRVNVNAVGNWDQLCQNWGSLGKYDPYFSISSLRNLANNAGPGGSEVDPIDYVENLSSSLGFGWINDRNHTTDDWDEADRGEGRGYASMSLSDALDSLFETANIQDITDTAARLMWKRYSNYVELKTNYLANFAWNVYDIQVNGNSVSQPGFSINGNETDASVVKSERYRFFDPKECKSSDHSTTGYIYPWRGKTSLTLSNLPFDFSDTGFRSYDPLGRQIYTNVPRYSANPYYTFLRSSSFGDSPYGISALEALLRPSDADGKLLDNSLVDDLGISGYSKRVRTKAKTSLTTLSADVPAASLVFPDAYKMNGDMRQGRYGFVNLIRRNVRLELERIFKEKGIYDDTDGDGKNDYLYGSGYGNNALLFSKKVDEITMYLASLLPKEILTGEKIDLNALTDKNYWLDLEYDDSGNLVLPDDLDAHNKGLAKRMEYARGLYIVLMTLIYEDLNAELCHPYSGYDSETGSIVESNLKNYFEDSFDLSVLQDQLGKDNDKTELLGRELIATRLAQWCVNVVDFSDPDATMTPFFFDPTPFDGWWVDGYDWIDGVGDDGNHAVMPTGDNLWKLNGWSNLADPAVNFLFPVSNGLPSEQMCDYFCAAFDEGKAYQKGGKVDELLNWMNRDIEKLSDQTKDLGFRLVWGMERPDLVLTETLNFHDLGIADTNIEWHTTEFDNRGYVKDGDDNDFDQVRRPKGSSYLELYCTANPNVPQSSELYVEDGGVWKLELSKMLPAYDDAGMETDSRNGNVYEWRFELDLPVWRVAISESSDPLSLNDYPDTGDDRFKTTNSPYLVKAENSVINRLSPQKDNNKYYNDFSLFSMQPRQFRNTPLLKTNDVGNISYLDPLRKIGTDLKPVIGNPEEIAEDIMVPSWLKYCDFFSANILGSAVAKAYDDDRLNKALGVTPASSAEEKKNARLLAAHRREIDLDRILWFVNFSIGDDSTLSGASNLPDALRTFVKNDASSTLLEPNHYLVVGPEVQRELGSAVAGAGTSEGDVEYQNRQYGQKHGVKGFTIDLNDLNYDPDAPGTPSRKYEYMVASSIVGNQEFNISEPLWTIPKKDPYYNDQDKSISNADTFYPAEKTGPDGQYPTTGVYDVPFDMPRSLDTCAPASGALDLPEETYEKFFNNIVANYPLVKDELFGLGTIPDYKTAFLQRAADPNRPYHPLLNPYITVDWNVMDLTIFNGEVETETETELIEACNKRLFSRDANYRWKDTANQIQLPKNLPLGLEDDDNKLALNDVFSSRAWGSAEQKMFSPNWASGARPNPWARAFKPCDKEAGLEHPAYPPESGPTARTYVKDGKYVAARFFPAHTLGGYNNRGAFETIEGTSQKWYSNLNNQVDFQNKFQSPNNSANIPEDYYYAPHTPFEHLVWNDAPFSNPVELLLVPASSSGRFGLEFIKAHKEGWNLEKLYHLESDKRGALGSYGIYGYDGWYNKKNVPDNGDLKKLDDKGTMGPYLNFFATSKEPGETLHLISLLDFVRVPSLEVDAKKMMTDPDGNTILDEDGNYLWRSTHRESAKVNLNTVTEAAWNALLSPKNLTSKTPWERFINWRRPFTAPDDNQDGIPDRVVEMVQAYFQPSYTTSLWTQMDQSPAPVPGFSTLLAGSNCYVDDDNALLKGPLFDNYQNVFGSGSYGSTDPANPQNKPFVGLDSYTYRMRVDDTDIFETTDNLKDILVKLATKGGVVSFQPSQSYQTQTRTVGSDIVNFADGTSNDLGDIFDNLAEDKPDGTPEDGVSSYEPLNSRGNLYEATAEMQRLSGLTTNRSNVFAAWVTVGYFELERCNPGVNMPKYDPDGNELNTDNLQDPSYKWYYYYQAIYPDGYTYGKELGSDDGEVKRHRGFSIIDRSIPVDFRRGNSVNYQDAIIMKRIID